MSTLSKSDNQREVEERVSEVDQFLADLRRYVTTDVDGTMAYLRAEDVVDYLIELRDGHMSEEAATRFDDDNPLAWNALENLASAYLQALRHVTPHPWQ